MSPSIESGNDPALSFDSVQKTFRQNGSGVPALRQLTFAIGSGAVTALVGPDGAGKTTLLRLAAGLLLPETGTIRVFGLDTRDQVDSVHQAIGYMPQRFGLYEDLSVAENLTLYADLHGLAQTERNHRFDELLQMTALRPFTARLAGQLSGGMKQKLGLACTLLSQPRLLLLDEPSVGVDPVSRRELWRIIDDQVRTIGMTVLLSTAYLDEAERCAEVLVLDAGELLERASPKDFVTRMQGHCYKATHSGFSNRELQHRLSRHPQIVDAIIQGGQVRVIVKTSNTDALQDLSIDSGKLSIETTTPRLEDAFISLLKTRYSTANAPTEVEEITVDATDEEVIKVDEVDRWFGSFQAVKKMSFSVNHGEIFGLLGANGAGKTTTFRMLCGLLPVSHGRLSVAGVDLRTAAARARARIGYMSQKFSLYAHLTVIQNLEFFSSVYGLNKNQRQRRIGWALEQFGLTRDRDSTSGDLSLGYKQRLAMACALMHEPQILFLDEPTSGVDPLTRREFWNRTSQLAASGVTVLVTTHFMEEAEYCDRLVIMVDGAILTVGTPEDIKRQVRSDRLPDPTMEDAFIALVEKE